MSYTGPCLNASRIPENLAIEDPGARAADRVLRGKACLDDLAALPFPIPCPRVTLNGISDSREPGPDVLAAVRGVHIASSVNTDTLRRFVASATDVQDVSAYIGDYTRLGEITEVLGELRAARTWNAEVFKLGPRDPWASRHLLENVLAHLPLLRELTLCSILSPDRFYGHLRNLEKLDMFGFPYDAPVMNNLRTLTLRYGGPRSTVLTRVLDDLNLINQENLCPRLEKLTIWARDCANTGEIEAALRGHPCLRTIVLKHGSGETRRDLRRIDRPKFVLGRAQTTVIVASVLKDNRTVTTTVECLRGCGPIWRAVTAYHGGYPDERTLRRTCTIIRFSARVYQESADDLERFFATGDVPITPATSLSRLVALANLFDRDDAPSSADKPYSRVADAIKARVAELSSEGVLHLLGATSEPDDVSVSVMGYSRGPRMPPTFGRAGSTILRLPEDERIASGAFPYPFPTDTMACSLADADLLCKLFSVKYGLWGMHISHVRSLPSPMPVGCLILRADHAKGSHDFANTADGALDVLGPEQLAIVRSLSISVNETEFSGSRLFEATAHRLTSARKVKIEFVGANARTGNAPAVAAFECLRHLPALECVKISSSFRASLKTLAFLPGNLLELHLPKARDLDDFPGAHFSDMLEALTLGAPPPAGLQLANLRRLRFRFREDSGNAREILRGVARSFPSLQELHVSVEPHAHLEDDDLTEIRELPGIEALKVVGTLAGNRKPLGLRPAVHGTIERPPDTPINIALGAYAHLVAITSGDMAVDLPELYRAWVDAGASDDIISISVPETDEEVLGSIKLLLEHGCLERNRSIEHLARLAMALQHIGHRRARRAFRNAISAALNEIPDFGELARFLGLFE